LGTLLDLYDNSRKLQIYYSQETRNQITSKFNSHNLAPNAEFTDIDSGQGIKVGPFSTTPFSVIHYENDKSSSPLLGCLPYVVELEDKKKIVIGWDFLSINDLDQNLLWNPDLVILGTETYNPHPSTGIISVTDAYDFVKRWNAKECFLVHYSGSAVHEDGKNQWFRGPVKAMTSTQLQRTTDELLKLTGNDGKFNITVVQEGQIWIADQNRKDEGVLENKLPIGRSLESESLNYILQFEKVEKENKLFLTIGDRINRYSLEFNNLT
jgi:hypothetical protein